MTPKQSWELARAELLRRIEAEIAEMPNGRKSIWNIEASDGDMTELPAMLRVIDGVLGSESQDYECLNVGLDPWITGI